MTIFTPCKVFGSLLEPLIEAASRAASGSTVLPSPVRFSVEEFRKEKQRGEGFVQFRNQ
jgi:UDP-N-acetylmuramoylalanine-D-glutamate ligase